MATTSAQIQELYVAYLGRAADKAGLDYWSAELNATPATLTLEDLRANFVNEQPEYAAIYGGLTREDTVVQIYNNLFGRAPDAAGLTYWTTGGGASVNVDLLLTAFVNGASAQDSQTVANKVLVAEVYTAAAGENNFLAADAATIIADVNFNNSTIADALDLLTDGSLGGIAVPAAISALQADAVADAAVTAFETNNVATLTALDKELVALSTTADTANLIGNVTASTATNYDDLATAIEAGITTARGGLNTETLTNTVATDTTALATARTAFVTNSAETGAIAKINAYDAAVKAAAANPGAVASDITQAQTAFSAYTTNPSNATAFAAAVTASGLPAGSDASDVYDALVSATATDAQIAQITSAFSSVSSFSALQTVAALEHSQAVAQASLTTATQALIVADVANPDATGTAASANWKTAYDKLTTDTASLNASKIVDAFEAKYNVTDTAHTSLENAADNTQDVVDASGALTAVTAGAGTAAKADVFHFTAAITQANDLAINFGTNDSLYLGQGYTLNTAGTVNTTTGVLTGGDNNALEVFFVKNAAGTVQAVVETSVTASTTADLKTVPTTGATDGVAVITLTGVTDVSQVTFANGVISHVA